MALKPIPIHLVLAAVLLCGCTARGGDAPSRREAETFMVSYVAALRSGNEVAIKGHWSKASLDRPGFEVMHLWIGELIHIGEWKDFLDGTGYEYKMDKLEGREGYCLVTGRWTRPGGESHPMPFHLVREGGRWLLANPIDVLTREWSRHETSSMIFYFPRGTRLEDHLEETERLDRDCLAMRRAMGLSGGRKTEYYKASSPEEVGRLLTQGAFNGLAAATYRDTVPWFGVAVSTTFYNPHEVMHAVSMPAGVPYSVPLFCEGLAVAYGGTTFQTPGFAHVFSRIMADRPEFIPLKTLLTMSKTDFLRASPLSYQESGSFIRWLMETRGWERLKGFIAGFDPAGDADAQLRKAFGSALDALEKEWRRYLDGIALLEPGFRVPEAAVPVFAMDDPAGDDKGDGNYRYPGTPGYEAGCFDLTRFEVLTARDTVYFRIGLKRLVAPVTNGAGGAKFLPSVVIAVNTGEQGKRQLFRSADDVDLPEGYDFKINAGFGVNVSDRFGKVFAASGDRYLEMADFGSNTLTFALPYGLVGEPGPGWRYFVGIGLANEPTFDFSGLVPVFKDTPGYISGGNFGFSNPAFIDVLLPEGADQAAILSDYDAEKGRLAAVGMVGGQGDVRDKRRR